MNFTDSSNPSASWEECSKLFRKTTKLFGSVPSCSFCFWPDLEEPLFPGVFLVEMKAELSLEYLTLQAWMDLGNSGI